MVIVAKPIINKQFWILQQNNQKIGNVTSFKDGYQVCINNKITRYKTINVLKQKTSIQFYPFITKKTITIPTHMVHTFPTASKVYNGLWNVAYKLPLFTKNKKSKCWFAAGWYRVCKYNHSSIIQDPKLITLLRYSYHGPFTTPEEAKHV